MPGRVRCGIAADLDQQEYRRGRCGPSTPMVALTFQMADVPTGPESRESLCRGAIFLPRDACLLQKQAIPAARTGQMAGVLYSVCTTTDIRLLHPRT
jgi:hypothetical protein